jgi:hypothetical protein
MSCVGSQELRADPETFCCCTQSSVTAAHHVRPRTCTSSRWAHPTAPARRSSQPHLQTQLARCHKPAASRASSTRFEQLGVLPSPARLLGSSPHLPYASLHRTYCRQLHAGCHKSHTSLLNTRQLQCAASGRSVLFAIAVGDAC